MHNKRTTGLTSAQVATPLNKNLIWNQPGTRPRKTSLTQALKITLIYLRHNITEDLLADIFDLSQVTVSRIINRIESALLKLTELKVPELESLKNVPGSLVIDGTLIPIWNWSSQGQILFSGKHRRTGFNHQVICTLDGGLLAITDPVPGARHDVYAFRFHQLERFLDESTLADKGYIGLGLFTPTKRKAGARMRARVKENNRRINRLRSVVERTIAQVKTWRVLDSEFWRPLGPYSRVFLVVQGLIFFAALNPL
ncbi:transposase family protein [Rothia terrae]|uniref:transposase family protein n=3 Tax=Rothia terrae TaxID=396015 RepID=UPI00381E3E5E